MYPGWDPPTDHQDWRRFPVVGISGEDARRYAGWLDTTRRLPGARLCSEVEWERAARGADGRSYPGGSAIAAGDANIDATHPDKLTGLEEIGSHPASVSPFGLEDTVGNAFEWTQSELDEHGYILRGGSYLYDRKTAHLANRAQVDGTVRNASYGFRLCASP